MTGRTKPPSGGVTFWSGPQQTIILNLIWSTTLLLDILTLIKSLLSHLVRDIIYVNISTNSSFPMLQLLLTRAQAPTYFSVPPTTMGHLVTLATCSLNQVSDHCQENELERTYQYLVGSRFSRQSRKDFRIHPPGEGGWSCVSLWDFFSNKTSLGNANHLQMPHLVLYVTNGEWLCGIRDSDSMRGVS